MDPVKGGYWNDIDTKKAADPGRHLGGCIYPGPAGGAERIEPLRGRYAVWREFPMSKAVKEKKGRAVPVWTGILAFLLAFGAGAAG